MGNKKIILKFLLSLTVLFLIGWIDLVTGSQISFSFFYLIPIIYLSFQKNTTKFVLIFSSLFATAMWIGADLGAGHVYSNNAIFIWNSTVRFVIFLVVPYLVFSMKIKEKLLLETNKIHDSQKSELETQQEELETISANLISASEEFNRYAIVAKEIDNSVIITDKYANFLWVNDSFKKKYKLTLEELKNNYDNKLFNFYNKENTSEYIEKCLTEKQTVRYRTKHVNEQGDYRYIQTTLTPIVSDNNEITKLIAIDADITTLIQTEKKAHEEQARADQLLNDILPVSIASELKTTGIVKPKYYKSASVLFTDFTAFTKKCEKLKPHEIINELDHWFLKFDEIVEKYNIEKIKTIGDAYMCAGGIPVESKDHPLKIILAAFEMIQFMNEYNTIKENFNQEKWLIRIGIHTGELIAGVIGKKRFIYDVWGDTVNIAARIVEQGDNGKINISEETYLLVRDYFDCTFRGKIQAKNKGKINMYFVDGLKQEYRYLLNEKI